MREYIVEVDLGDDLLQVEKCGKTQYQVLVNGVVKHPAGHADNAIRALGHYIQGLSSQLSKIAPK